MKAELKEQWIAELRSDNWYQIKGRLSDEDQGRCCLGVLCEISPEVERYEPQQSPYMVDLDNIGYKFPNGEFNHMTLAADFIEAQGVLEDRTGEWASGILARMNDEGLPFNQIADWVELNVKED